MYKIYIYNSSARAKGNILREEKNKSVAISVQIF